MGLVVGTVEIYAIPAGGEEDLCSHAIGALVREEVWSFS